MDENEKMQDAEARLWKQRRYTIAKEILPELARENYEFAVRAGKIFQPDEIAKQAVEYADELIKALKKEPEK